ncbi:hypothetical protein LCGC14_1601040, partial [marine sediment metagenome]
MGFLDLFKSPTQKKMEREWLLQNNKKALVRRIWLMTIGAGELKSRATMIIASMMNMEGENVDKFHDYSEFVIGTIDKWTEEWESFEEKSWNHIVEHSLDIDLEES